MTMEQLLEAEQRAAEWIRKARKIPPSSIENPPSASTGWSEEEVGVETCTPLEYRGGSSRGALCFSFWKFLHAMVEGIPKNFLP